VNDGWKTVVIWLWAASAYEYILESGDACDFENTPKPTHRFRTLCTYHADSRKENHAPLFKDFSSSCCLGFVILNRCWSGPDDDWIAWFICEQESLERWSASGENVYACTILGVWPIDWLLRKDIGRDLTPAVSIDYRNQYTVVHSEMNVYKVFHKSYRKTVVLNKYICGTLQRLGEFYIKDIWRYCLRRACRYRISGCFLNSDGQWVFLDSMINCTVIGAPILTLNGISCEIWSTIWLSF